MTHQRLHQEAPEVFDGWAEQMAHAKRYGGRSRREGATGAMAGFLAHFYSTEIADPDRWSVPVEAFVDRSSNGPQSDLAGLYRDAMVAYLGRQTAS